MLMEVTKGHKSCDQTRIVSCSQKNLAPITGELSGVDLKLLLQGIIRKIMLKVDGIQLNEKLLLQCKQRAPHQNFGGTVFVTFVDKYAAQVVQGTHYYRSKSSWGAAFA